MASEAQAPEDANGKEPTLQSPADIKSEEDESELGVRPKIGVNSIKLQQDESELRERVRKDCRSGVLTRFCINGYSAVLVFVRYLISLESLFSIALAVSLTVYTYNRVEDNDEFDGTTMNWTLLSFAVITPMSASITMAFNRREQALIHLAVVKATLLNIYSAHACWDWTKPSKAPSGRVLSELNWEEHADEVMSTIFKVTIELSRMLTLPTPTRARHRVTAAGMKESAEILAIMSKLNRSILVRMCRLTQLCEVLKEEGLPPNEATRIRQWERLVAERFENLRVIKIFRTPQALRSFARLFSVFLPPFYAPFYGQMAKDLNSLGTAIAFSILTSIALTSLFESISQMEDPFTGIIALDGIDLTTELRVEFCQELLDWREELFPDAKTFEVPEDSVVLLGEPEILLFRTS